MATQLLDLIEYIQKSPNGMLKTQAGLLDRMQLFLSSQSKENREFADMLKYLVELDGGLYVDARKQPTFTSNLIYDNDFLKEKIAVVKVDNVTDLSLERAMKLKRDSEKQGQQVIIKIDSEGNHPSQNVAYRLDKYIALMQRYNEILKGIDFHLPEKDKFARIYSRVANAVEYDYAAGNPVSRDEKIYTLAKHNTIVNNDALIQGKGLDLATGVVINQAAKLTGIKAIMVNGFKYSVRTKKELENYNINNGSDMEKAQELDDGRVIVKTPHTWNKVKLEGTWYNVFALPDRMDLERRQIPSMAFLSDKMYQRLGFVEQNDIGSIEPCKVNMSEAELKELFPRARKFSHRNLVFDEAVLKLTTGEKLKSVQNEITFNQIKDNILTVGNGIKKIARKISGISVPVSMPKLPAPKEKEKQEEVTDYKFETRNENIRPTNNPEYTTLDSFNQTMRTVREYQLKTMGIEQKDPSTPLYDAIGGERQRDGNTSWDQMGRPSIGLNPIREMSDNNPDAPSPNPQNNNKPNLIIKHNNKPRPKDTNDKNSDVR